ncbi:unnamed protein product [Urochloa humidicola]
MNKAPLVTPVNNMDHLKSIENDHYDNKLVVLEYMAPWSEPYKFMIEAVEEIAKDYEPYAKFYTIDIDKFKEHAREKQVEALPTFLVQKKRKNMARIVGIDEDELKSKIDELKEEPAVSTELKSRIDESRQISDTTNPSIPNTTSPSNSTAQSDNKKESEYPCNIL